MPSIPSARTRSSTRRVDTPDTYASWTTASRARSARRRGSSRLGKYEPSRTRGTARSIVPTRVSQRRSRYPLRWVRRCSGLRSPLASPVSSLTSASMIAWARRRTPSRRMSTSPSTLTLRRVSSRDMLSSAIVVFSVSSVCHSNDARISGGRSRSRTRRFSTKLWGHGRQLPGVPGPGSPAEGPPPEPDAFAADTRGTASPAAAATP